MTAARSTSAWLRILWLAFVVTMAGCKERESDEVRPKEVARPKKEQAASGAPGEGWQVKMSNDLLERWMLACGGPTGPPTADNSEITVFLDDQAQGTNCTLRYTQASMQIHDIQVALTDSDPQQADAKFIEFVDDVLTPLLPPAIALRVRTDAVNRETYVSKGVGGFTVAMRTESVGGTTTRWLWVFRGST